ncbi:MAG TPA: hypothetical protein VM802_20755 [Chitinophaga sp.]|uniref:hypothetical protein n=1 Tax=Chitinophaga sp. TaxID=1869181 RepID=UPI002BB31DA4|nr:hypothetical protein [Chitinophaga sp.]HVI47321.1 hypothetical protein [Chitinophaga sp.]
MDELNINILAIGYNQPIMDVVLRLINSHNYWNGAVALSREDAVNNLKERELDVILLCAGVSPEDEEYFRRTAKTINTDTKVIRHFGGGSGLLESEIRTALNK